MNDLAEKALQGVGAARAQIRRRPMVALSVIGFAVSTLVVVAGGQVGAARSTRAVTTWLGVEDSRGATAQDRLPGTVMFAAIATLVVLWLVAIRVVRRTDQPRRRVWWTAGAWAAPFALGPPLLDTSVYSYVAYGLVQRNGLNPYVTAPDRIGSSVVGAIDPGARDVASAAGPLGTLVQHLSVSVSSGSALGAVLVFRVIGVLAAIAICRFAGNLGDHSGRTLSMCALNPLVLLYVVSAPHLDGLMMAIVLAALVAARQQRWRAAVALAAIGAAVLPQALVALPILIVAHRVARPRHGWRVLGGDVVIAAAVTAAARLLQPDGFGWIRTVGDQFNTDTPFSIAGATARIIAPIVRVATYDDLAAGARLATLIAATVIVGYLAVTPRQRPVEQGVGYALLTVGLFAPTLHPWYLLWGLLCLAPTAAGAQRVWVPAACAAACLLTPPGFSELTTNWVTGAALVAVTALGVGPLLRADRRSREEAGASAERADEVVSAET